MENNNGFIALISSVVIASVVLTLSFTLSQSSFLARFDEVSNETKKVSYSLAEACVNSALLNIAIDQNYSPSTGGDVVDVGGNLCKICEIQQDSPNPGQTTVLTRSSYRNAVTNLTVWVTFLAGDYVVEFWDEQADYTGPICDIL